jgi:hypothetical protein
MTNATKNVVSGKPKSTGGVLRAPLGSTGPTDVSTALDAAFKAAGYVHEDGLTKSIGRSTEKVKAWGGDVVKITQTEHSVTLAFGFIEVMNETVLKALNGDDRVTVTPATTTAGTLTEVEVTGDELPASMYVFEIKDGDARIRIFAPNAHLTEQGDTTYSDSDVIQYPVTYEALPDESGVKLYEWSDDGVKAIA